MPVSEGVSGVIDKAQGKAALGQIDGSQRDEFLNIEKSADPFDRAMQTDDPRGYYTNKKARKYYKNIKSLQLVERPTTIQMGGEQLLTAAAGSIANLGNGMLVCRETVRLGGGVIRRGDRLECITDAQVFNKTAMREQKILSRYAESYQMESARDAYRHPVGLTGPNIPAASAHGSLSSSSSVDPDASIAYQGLGSRAGDGSFVKQEDIKSFSSPYGKKP